MESLHYALNNSGNVTTIFNPSPLPRPDEIDKFPWQKIDWLLVNEGEALDLHSVLTHQDQENGTPIRDIIAGLSDQPPLSQTNIICTLGKDGVLAFIPTCHKPKSLHDAPSFMYFPAAKLQGTTRDTTGAGDCFTGYFVQGLMEFDAHAKVGREIREEDVARILKICVQVGIHCFFWTHLRLIMFRLQGCALRSMEQLKAYRIEQRWIHGCLLTESSSTLIYTVHKTFLKNCLPALALYGIGLLVF